MALADWLDRYPQVQRLLQAPDDVLCYALEPSGPCCATDVEYGRAGPRPVRCDLDATVQAPNGDPYCGWHFERFWVYPCCGERRAVAVPSGWCGNREVEYHQTDAFWCEACCAAVDAEAAD